MVSQTLLRSFELTFRIATILRIVPFTYKPKQKKLSVRKTIFAALGGSAFMLRALYGIVTITGFVMTETVMENLQETCLLGLQIIMFGANGMYQLNFWRKNTEICWLFNQIQDFNKGYACSPVSTMKEKAMLGWGPGNLNLLIMLLADLILKPEGKQHVFSMVPQEYATNTAVFGIYFIYDALTIFAFVCNGLMECQMEYLIIQTLANWTTNMSSRKVKSESKFRAVIRSYRCCDMTLRSFNHSMGSNIEMTKTLMAMFCIVGNYLLIRHHAILSVNLLSFLVFAVCFTHTVPPMLYQDACQPEGRCHVVRRRLGEALKFLGESKRVCERELKSLPPLRIRVAGMYSMGRTMTPNYFSFILEYTANALISY